MNESAANGVKVGGKLRRCVLWVILVLGLLVVLPWTVLAALSRIAVGFVAHARSAVWPALVGNASELLLPLLCLALVVVFGHRMLVWLGVHRGVVWRARHSLCVFALVLLASASAIAMSGVVHQMAWLGSSRWVRSSNSKEWLAQHKALRNITQGITWYVDRHGRYPDSLEEIAGEVPVEGVVFRVPVESAGPEEPIQYRKPSGKSDTELMLVGSVFRGAIVVAFSNGLIENLTPEEFRDLTSQWEGGNADEK